MSDQDIREGGEWAAFVAGLYRADSQHGIMDSWSAEDDHFRCENEAGNQTEGPTKIITKTGKRKNPSIKQDPKTSKRRTEQKVTEKVAEKASKEEKKAEKKANEFFQSQSNDDDKAMDLESSNASSGEISTEDIRSDGVYKHYESNIKSLYTKGRFNPKLFQKDPLNILPYLREHLFKNFNVELNQIPSGIVLLKERRKDHLKGYVLPFFKDPSKSGRLHDSFLEKLIKRKCIKHSAMVILKRNFLYKSIVSTATSKAVLKKLNENTEHQIEVNLLKRIKFAQGLPTEQERMEYLEKVRKMDNRVFKKPLTFLENNQALTLFYKTLKKYAKGCRRDPNFLQPIIDDLESERKKIRKEMKVPEGYQEKVGCPFAVIHPN